MRRARRTTPGLLAAVFGVGGALTLCGCSSNVSQPSAEDRARMDEAKQARQAENTGTPAPGSTDSGQQVTTDAK